MVSGTWRSGWHEREQFPIVVTDHTIDRLRSRAPTMRFPDEVTVRLEVAATLREGCVSTRSPAWLGRDYRRRTRRTRDAATIRYVWTADEARPYVLRFERSHDHGGIGKTRLSLQAAAAEVERFRDGAYFVDLSTARDAGAALQAIVRALGVTLSGDEELRVALAEQLRAASSCSSWTTSSR
jgi:hypothetical protein